MPLGYKNQLEPPPCCKVPNTLLHAGAGVQSEVVKLYKEFLNQDIIPAMPNSGSISKKISPAQTPLQKELQTTIIMATKDLFENRIKFKEIYEYDMTRKQLFKNGEEVQMPKNEAKLFFLLVSNIDKVVSYEVIENYVWGEKSMSNEALRMTIKKIRAKTDADLIKNISGVGYRLSVAN